MSKPKITKLNYTYRNPDTDVWVLNTDDIPVSKDLIKDQQIVHLSPKSYGGNHKHSRIEWFVAIGDLTFIWLDKSGKRHEDHMNPNGEILLFEVPSHLPHAVINNSDTKNGILFEYADGKLIDEKEVSII